jgi:CRP/FNR family transcriptional regulator, cyclic AMP receptor protein
VALENKAATGTPEPGMATRRALVPLLEADAELAAQLAPALPEAATRAIVAPLVVLERGENAAAVVPQELGGLGLLVLDGLLVEDTTVAGEVVAELIGPGDLLPPVAVTAEDLALIPMRRQLIAAEVTRVAVLDRRFAVMSSRWPDVTAALMERTNRRIRRLALQQAIANLPRVDTRLHVLLWHLAERWGRVTPDGVVVPLRLPHRSLARLVGARRPSVTTALTGMVRRGLLQRRPDGGWLLLGIPPTVPESADGDPTAWQPTRLKHVGAPGEEPLIRTPTPELVTSPQLAQQLDRLRAASDRHLSELAAVCARSRAVREETAGLTAEIRRMRARRR